MPDRSLRPLAVAGPWRSSRSACWHSRSATGGSGADVGRGGRFCEAARDGTVLQPANCLSNLGFVVAGLLIAFQAGRPSTLGDVLPRYRGLATAYACVVVLLGPGSAAMHATQAELGGDLDLLSMYLVAAFAAAYAVDALGAPGRRLLRPALPADGGGLPAGRAVRRGGPGRPVRRQRRVRRAAADRNDRRGAAVAAGPVPHRPAVRRGRARHDAGGVRDLERRPARPLRPATRCSRRTPPGTCCAPWRRTCCSGCGPASATRRADQGADYSVDRVHGRLLGARAGPVDALVLGVRVGGVVGRHQATGALVTHLAADRSLEVSASDSASASSQTSGSSWRSRSSMVSPSSSSRAVTPFALEPRRCSGGEIPRRGCRPPRGRRACPVVAAGRRPCLDRTPGGRCRVPPGRRQSSSASIAAARAAPSVSTGR